ncbi:hypothetical protein AB0H49_05460 [Nocardia sp. NPDC050713]
MVQLLAMAVGRPELFGRETALITREQVGTHRAGWFQVQPLWDQVS